MRLGYTTGERRKGEKDCRTSVRRKENKMAELIIVVSYFFNIAQFSTFWPIRGPNLADC